VSVERLRCAVPRRSTALTTNQADIRPDGQRSVSAGVQIDDIDHEDTDPTAAPPTATPAATRLTGMRASAVDARTDGRRSPGDLADSLPKIICVTARS
jgi:hypothetical protein